MDRSFLDPDPIFLDSDSDDSSEPPFVSLRSSNGGVYVRDSISPSPSVESVYGRDSVSPSPSNDAVDEMDSDDDDSVIFVGEVQGPDSSPVPESMEDDASVYDNTVPENYEEEEKRPSKIIRVELDVGSLPRQTKNSLKETISTPEAFNNFLEDLNPYETVNGLDVLNGGTLVFYEKPFVVEELEKLQILIDYGIADFVFRRETPQRSRTTPLISVFPETTDIEDFKFLLVDVLRYLQIIASRYKVDVSRIRLDHFGHRNGKVFIYKFDFAEDSTIKEYTSEGALFVGNIVQVPEFLPGEFDSQVNMALQLLRLKRIDVPVFFHSNVVNTYQDRSFLLADQVNALADIRNDMFKPGTTEREIVNRALLAINTLQQGI